MDEHILLTSPEPGRQAKTAIRCEKVDASPGKGRKRFADINCVGLMPPLSWNRSSHDCASSKIVQEIESEL